MKKMEPFKLKLRYFFFHVFFISMSGFGFELPERPGTPILDQAGIVNQDDRVQIIAIAEALWKQADFGLVIAVVNSLDDTTVEDYATRLYKKWGIGGKEKDEGVLVLLSLNPRKVRIEVGYGAEGYLNDAKCGRILDEYGVPYFRENDFSAGLKSVAAVIAGVVSSEKKVSLNLNMGGEYYPQKKLKRVKLTIWHIILIILALLFLLGTPIGRFILLNLILSSLLGGGRGGGGGGFGSFGGGFGGGMSGGGGSSRSF